MKILQINNVYDYGSTGKITKDIHTGLLEKGCESVVIYGRRQKTSCGNVYKLCPEWYSKLNNLISRFTGMMYGGCHLSTRRIINRIRREKPDIVHLQCLNGYFVNIYRLLEWLKKENIKTVLTLHAEFMYTANCGHAGECNQWKDGCGKCRQFREHTRSLFLDRTGESWHRIHKIYEGWDNLTIVACSDWIKKRAEQSKGFRDKKIIKINNGIENEKVFYDRKSSEEIREKYNIPEEEKVAIYVSSSFSELKGFDFVLKLIDKCRDIPVHFLLVGDEYDSSNEKVTVVGKVEDQHYLAKLYSSADVMIMCSRNDNYPTVNLEAASCGTPVVAFNIGGVAETIYPGMGRCVEFADLKAMKNAMIEIFKTEQDDSVVQQAREYNSKKRMVAEYIETYKEIVERGKNE